MAEQQTIRERTLDVGGRLLISFTTERAGIENDKRTSEVWVFKVLRVFDRFIYKYSGLEQMDDGDTLEFDYLGEDGHGSGDDILRIEQDDWHVMHFGYAPEESDLKIWESTPVMRHGGTAIDRHNPDEFAQVGDDFDYIDGNMIEDKYNPPEITERVSFRNDSDGEFAQFGFENDSGEEIAEADNILWLTGASYKLMPVMDGDRRKDIIRESFKKPKDREIQIANITVGGIYDYRMGEAIPDDWQDTRNFEIVDRDILRIVEEGSIGR